MYGFGSRTRAAAFAALVGLLAVPSAGLAVDDTTPPQGTLVINGGAGWTAEPVLTLDVPATDDVGVTLVRIHHSRDGTWSAWTEFPSAPQIMYSLGDPGGLADGIYAVEVDWRDAAFNGFSAMASIGFDRTPPDLHTFQRWSDTGPPGTVTFNLGADDPSSGVTAARFSTTNGASWGAELPLVDQLVAWNPRDPAQGGTSSGIGDVVVSAQVRDAVGNWSSVRTMTVTLSVTVGIAVSPNPSTGKPITFTPSWSAPVSLPSGTHCLWEFMTGDDQSLYYGDRNGTFSYILTQGPASGNWCGPWTFTLPWSSVLQYLVAFRAILPDGSSIDAMIGGSPDETAFSPSVGSTSRSITSSSMPMFHVLPDDYELTVGTPTTYRAVAVGGATIRSSDQWVVEYANVPEVYPGSAALTFTPRKTGDLTVCLYRRAGPGDPTDQLGACFDPPVKAGTSGGSGGGGSGGVGAATASPTGASLEPSPSGDGSTLNPTATSTPHSAPTRGPVAAGGPTATPQGVPTVTGPTKKTAGQWLVLVGLVTLVSGAIAFANPKVRTAVRATMDRVRVRHR